MEILTSLYQRQILEPTAVTVGKFDGIHLGHELLTHNLIRQEKIGRKSVVITFDTSPRISLKKDLTKVLITNEERIQRMRHSGISYLIQCPFEQEIRDLSPEDFIRVLVQELHMEYMTCGTDFRFGSQGRGDVAMLRQLADTYGFTLDVMDKVTCDERVISSTLIREEITRGHVAEAARLLGYPYFVWGVVVHGNHLGRQYSMPTINVYPSPEKLLPPNGVYVTEVELDHHKYHGVTNVGVKPTIGDANRMGIETHILDFSRDVYQKSARITFLEFLRPEMKFDSLEELFHQMLQDKKTAIAYFNRK
jgi:riboflavin kinase/FMN adenylyltransferase